MGDSSPYPKPHFSYSELNSPIRRNPIGLGKCKTYSNFLYKSIFFTFILILLSLFPSQAPEFINQTMLTKFWELIHLLFIGIAVSYGLFCRRKVDLDVETNNEMDDTPSYVSKIFSFSPIFDDGYKISCGSDEKRFNLSWSSQYHNEYYKHLKMSISESELDCSFGSGENKLVQAWNSEYFQSGPEIIVAQPNCKLESGEVMVYKPLGLPIRSLRPRRGSVGPEFVSGSESGSSSRGSSRSSSLSRNGKFGDLGPSNLEQKFNEAAVSTSPIPWRSRSVRMEDKERHGLSSRPSHFRPLSVDETQFESLGGRSFRSASSASSQNSPHSSVDSVPFGNMNLQKEDVEKENSLHGSSSSDSPSPPPHITRKASLDSIHSRGYSIGSVLLEDERRNFEDDLVGLNGNGREERLVSKRSGGGSLRSDPKPACSSKTPSRGKSVRTIRPNRMNLEKMKVGDESNGKTDNFTVEKIDDNSEPMLTRKEKMRNEANYRLVRDAARQNIETPIPEIRTRLPKHQNIERQDPSKNLEVGSNEDLVRELESFKESPNKDAASECFSDAGFDSNEVDKKAGEFIAKFREQIRLQKMASIGRSKGLKTGRNHFR